MKHRTWVNLLMALWAVCATRVVYAATFADDLRALDYESIALSVFAGLLGGALRTIFTLASENRPVWQVVLEARRDMVVAMMAGGAAYLLMYAIASKYPDLITREIRPVVILAAGWARLNFFRRVNQLANSGLDNVNQKVRNGAPADPPPAAPPPLNDRSPS